MNTKNTHGFTLIELMMVVSLIAILMLFSGQFFMNQLKQYSAAAIVKATALGFIQDVQLAKTLATSLQKPVTITPRCFNSWDTGWRVFVNSNMQFDNQQDNILVRFALKEVTTIPPKGIKPPSGNQFSDVSLKYLFSQCQFALTTPPIQADSQTKHLSFNPLGAAQTKNGGFVANRLVFWSKEYSQVTYQVILGAGGRLRLCQPSKINPQCSN
jgi:type IV fimbrial biogenesis protein FimT